MSPLDAERAAPAIAGGDPQMDMLPGASVEKNSPLLLPAQAGPRAPRALWEHQAKGIASLREAVRAGASRVVLALATGGGKTRLAAEIVRGALAKKKRVAFIVPLTTLVDQTVAAFMAEGIGAIGVMQAAHHMTDASQPVQVISAQTLARRKRPDADVVIVDECHIQHKAVLQWMLDRPDVRFIGLSATPWARGMGRYWDRLIVVATAPELIDQRVLTPVNVFAPVVPDLAGVKIGRNGDYDEDALADQMSRADVTGDFVREWKDRGQNRPTILFAINRAHGRYSQALFNEAGIPCAYIDGTTPQEERQRVFKALECGEVKIVVNIDVLTAGVNLPFVSCIIDVRPTRSEIRLVQAYGRGLRSHPGKHNCIILDHAGNSLRLGLVTDLHRTELDSGDRKDGKKATAKEQEKPLPRLCDGCKAVLPNGVVKCPHCGAVHLPKAAPASRDGRLVELRSGDHGAIKATWIEKALFHAELKGLARERGYSPGWASNQFREFFGVWPNDPRVRSVNATKPSQKTRDWVRLHQIAFAKERARHG